MEAAVDWLGRVPRRLPDFWTGPAAPACFLPSDRPGRVLRTGWDVGSLDSSSRDPTSQGFVCCVWRPSPGAAGHTRLEGQRDWRSLPFALLAWLPRSVPCLHTGLVCSQAVHARSGHSAHSARSLLSSPPQAGWAEAHDQCGALLMVPLLAEVEHTDPLAASSSPTCGPAPSASWRVGPSGMELPSGRALVQTPAHSTGGGRHRP